MILLITPFYLPNIGGVEIHLADYINFLKSKKITAYVLTYQPITSNYKAPFKEIIGSVTIYRFPYIGLNFFYKLEPYPLVQFLYLFLGLFFYTFIFLILNSKKVRVIHSHGLACSLISGLLGKIFRKHTVVSLHTIYKFANRRRLGFFASKILKINNSVLAIAEGCKKDLISVGVEDKKIFVYSYWVNTDKFCPLEKAKCRRQLNLPINKFIALFIGRFNKEKQVKEALEASAITNNILAIFIGQGPLEAEIRKYATRYPNIKLVGRVENDNLPLYHNAADILLLGSIDEDYFGKVTMEAMSSGLPVILSNKSYYFNTMKAINHNILPENCGFMVDLSPQEISTKLKDTFKNKDKIKSMRNHCRNFALRNFSKSNANIVYKAYGF